MCKFFTFIKLLTKEEGYGILLIEHMFDFGEFVVYNFIEIERLPQIGENFWKILE